MPNDGLSRGLRFYLQRALLAGMLLMSLSVTQAAAQGHAQGGELSPAVRAAAGQLRAALAGEGSQGMPFVIVSIGEQRLFLFEGSQLVARYPVSTATKGAGNRAGSDQTPLGLHRVAEKFGEEAPEGMIFKARRPTGEVAHILKAAVDVPEDHVTTRILWLDGLEPGVNKGPGIDSKSRFIYIHGTPEEGLIGQPASHGCVRMRNADVIALFDRLPVGARVSIIP
ncbi:MAG: L,D-transpeptidase [Halothiobacillaceae bacterium]|nr:L,D-transpeptidase [Halothiobacillaceae bacterium]